MSCALNARIQTIELETERLSTVASKRNDSLTQVTALDSFFLGYVSFYHIVVYVQRSHHVAFHSTTCFFLSNQFFISI